MKVAIIGAGAAGCYCAYRLAQERPKWTVDLYEASDRIGGRLWSVEIAGSDGPPAEMGAMSIGSGHDNLWRLIPYLGLQVRETKDPDRHQYLRGVYLDDNEYAKEPNRVPYKLRGWEKGKFPKLLLLYALASIVPDFWKIWPVKKHLSPQATYAKLQSATHIDGRLLSDCGFWNVLNDRLSNEAYNLLLSTIGISSIFSNANALECVWTLLRNIDFDQTYYQLVGGYQKLPLTLQAAAEGVGAHLNHRLTSLTRADEGFNLDFDIAPDETVTRTASVVILALPRLALKAINYGPKVLDHPKKFKKDLDAVISTAATRVYLMFDTPWWERSKSGPNFLEPFEIAAAYTDLPMRKCHYFGKPQTRGPVLMMGACTDDVANSYWQGLADSGGAYPNPAASPQDQALTACSPAIAAAARRQLSEMHEDTDAPEPVGALYVDWGSEAHGAGWHEWAPKQKSWEVGPRVQQPNAKGDIFVCGEAYSQRQGWVEGALNTAEAVLRRLGLDEAPWLKAEAHAARPEGETGMKNKLLELVIALSESLPLQRAYANDDDAIMKAFGLNEREIAALKSNDPETVRSAAGGVGVFNTTITVKLPECP